MEDRYIGKMLDNRYEILDILGVGGMAVVYKAKCHRLNRLVAVKILKPELAEDEEIRRRFHDESQAVGMLSHPNIVNVFDVSQSEGVEYMVMELIEGITLKQYMSKRGGVLNWREGLHFMNQILQALKHAHSRGIIHRDIKPQNIMVLRDGSVKVADFGIARIMDSQKTMTQEALGSVHYISPEQAKGSDIDPRSDLYSAGVVLYEMLTGRLPYEGDSPVAVALQHINCIPLAPREQNPDIPEGMEQIIMKAMAPDRELRYADADAMLADLEEFRKNPAIVFPYEDPWKMSGLSVARPRKVTPVTPAPEPVSNVSTPVEEEPAQEAVAGNKHMPLIIGGVVASILLVIALIFRMLWPFFSEYFQAATVYTVPNLLGMTYPEAQEYILTDSALSGHFTITVSEETGYNDQYEPEEIILQTPSGDTTTKAETTEITVVLNSESAEETETRYMPNILGENYETWASTLSSEYRVTVKYNPQYDDEVPEGNIISTNPEAGEILNEGDTVTITYSKGKKITTTTMVTLYGMTEQKARETIEGLGLTVGRVDQVDSDEAAGTVVFQSVKAGASVELGTKVDLQISSGPVVPEQPDESEEETPPTEEEPTQEPEQPTEEEPTNPDQSEEETPTDTDQSDDNGEHEQEDQEHIIEITLPSDRAEESVIVVTVNGTEYWTKKVNADVETLQVKYKGTIESVKVTVDDVEQPDSWRIL